MAQSSPTPNQNHNFCKTSGVKSWDHATYQLGSKDDGRRREFVPEVDLSISWTEGDFGGGT